MEYTHYMEARILSQDDLTPSKEEVSFTTSKIMRSVHLHIVEGHNVALAFPDMQARTISEMNMTTTGSIIRIFGQEESLTSLLDRDDFASLRDAAFFSLGKEAIRAVPENSKTEIYKRDRMIEKEFPKYAIRNARNPGQEAYVSSAGAAYRAGRQRTAAYVRMNSSSTGNRVFSLFVSRNDNDPNYTGKLNTYGLGVPVPAF